jgi:Ferritin-like domain
LAVGPTRRAVLAASAAAVPLLVSACRGVQVLGTPPGTAPDVRLLRSAIAAERLMVARYRAAVAEASPAAHPAVATLTGILAEHEQHLAQLNARLVVPEGSASKSPPAAAASGSLPAGLANALLALETAEQDASDTLASQLLRVPPSLAQLMASISASEATHVPVLRSLGRVR